MKLPWKDFKMPEGETLKRTYKCVQDKRNTSVSYGRRHSFRLRMREKGRLLKMIHFTC